VPPGTERMRTTSFDKLPPGTYRVTVGSKDRTQRVTDIFIVLA